LKFRIADYSRVNGYGFRVTGKGLRVRVRGYGFRVQGLESRVKD
jgi:hypothetical protein